MKPDEGLEVVSRARGIAMSEARPWLSMYNITIISTDVSAARPTAQKVSASGGTYWLELIMSRTTSRHWQPKKVWT